MKVGIRKNIYSHGEAYDLIERIVCRNKHGRSLKKNYKHLSKLGRNNLKTGKVDGINLHNYVSED